MPSEPSTPHQYPKTVCAAKVSSTSSTQRRGFNEFTSVMVAAADLFTFASASPFARIAAASAMPTWLISWALA